jgi:hypothetical protein
VVGMTVWDQRWMAPLVDMMDVLIGPEFRSPPRVLVPVQSCGYAAHASVIKKRQGPRLSPRALRYQIFTVAERC